MFTNATFFLPMLAAVVAAVVTSWYYGSRQEEGYHRSREEDRRKRRDSREENNQEEENNQKEENNQEEENNREKEDYHRRRRRQEKDYNSNTNGTADGSAGDSSNWNQPGDGELKRRQTKRQLERSNDCIMEELLTGLRTHVCQNAAKQRNRRSAAGPDASVDERSADEHIHELKQEVIDLKQKVIDLKQKVIDLEADRTCILCYEKLRCVLFDCSHLVTCDECAAELEDCPICSRSIKKKTSVSLFN